MSGILFFDKKIVQKPVDCIKKQSFQKAHHMFHGFSNEEYISVVQSFWPFNQSSQTIYHLRQRSRLFFDSEIPRSYMHQSNQLTSVWNRTCSLQLVSSSGLRKALGADIPLHLHVDWPFLQTKTPKVWLKTWPRWPYRTIHIKWVRVGPGTYGIEWGKVSCRNGAAVKGVSRMSEFLEQDHSWLKKGSQLQLVLDTHNRGIIWDSSVRLS